VRISDPGNRAWHVFGVPRPAPWTTGSLRIVSEGDRWVTKPRTRLVYTRSILAVDGVDGAWWHPSGSAGATTILGATYPSPADTEAVAAATILDWRCWAGYHVVKVADGSVALAAAPDKSGIAPVLMLRWSAATLFAVQTRVATDPVGSVEIPAPLAGLTEALLADALGEPVPRIDLAVAP